MATRRVVIHTPVSIRTVQLAATTPTLLLSKSRSWRRVILRGVPITHTIYMGTSRNFSAASAFLIPGATQASTSQAFIQAFTMDWPPDNEIWIISQSADALMMISYDIPDPGAVSSVMV